MKFKVKMSHLICMFAMLFAAPLLTVAIANEAQQLIQGMKKFGTDLFNQLAAAKDYAQKNIILSPLSIHTCLTMASLGAGGQTADQMNKALGLPATNLAESYHSILAQYEKSTLLKMANKIYVKTGYTVKQNFKDLLANQFYSEVEIVDFSKKESAAKTISAWVEGKTNNLIKDLVKPESLTDSTRLVLVNAIHFMGNWVHQFNEDLTAKRKFYLDETKTTQVEIMGIPEGNFKYADLSNLDARVVELPYKNSDLAMLVILPKSRTGLAKLEDQLKGTSLVSITQQLVPTELTLGLPKFKAEFRADLSKPLSNMGMQQIFSSAADFSNMLKSTESLEISSVIHQAVIEVNERGTEAAAATEGDIDTRFGIPSFLANHPFHYIIKNAANVVIFEGNFKNNQ